MAGYGVATWAGLGEAFTLGELLAMAAEVGLRVMASAPAAPR
ncbi:hypothetical protein [Streptomyces mirabilis]